MSMPVIKEITIDNPHAIKKMGTSGLRETQDVYNRPLFLEQFTQGIASYFRELTDSHTVSEKNDTLLLGGDPRKGNSGRIRTMASILAANGFRVIIAENGIASTPAMSHGIRSLKTAGGIILTASHNPFTDVGIKVNNAGGAPALDDTVDRIHQFQNRCDRFLTTDYDAAEAMGLISRVNIIAMYADLLDGIFGFTEMRKMIAERGIRGAFDAMHGAAGPFAREVFINRLGMDTVILREEPREDLGGCDEKGEPLHPEPDFDYIERLIEMNNTGQFDIVSAWDSDVDRRLDGGRGFFVESADEFALFARYGDLIGLDRLFDGTMYFCRSTVTAGSVDKMEAWLTEKYKPMPVKIVETPTGFKWIAELGNWGVEESNGVGNPFLREKDGIFSTVFLLKIILHTGKNPRELMEDIWKDFGRVYFTRGEVSGSDMSEMEQLKNIFNGSPGQAGERFGDLILNTACSWDYRHPVTGELASLNGAWVLEFSEGNTVKARFSGTGSGGYTLRVYCSKYDRRYSLPKAAITGPMKKAFNEFLVRNGFRGQSRKYTDANQPDVYR
ncbi:MAG: hypothetical protein CVV44_09740 [Spirochaetae bacterium HGW-Spirochaetae-1]|jgi:phosphoglucomutase|nr:MAG: hypothetical protein CVV44_09740 [Spirochaetae bacterium HGW-Spirochaetae-1]